jgi:hypothetical protein
MEMEEINYLYLNLYLFLYSVSTTFKISLKRISNIFPVKAVLFVNTVLPFFRVNIFYQKAEINLDTYLLYNQDFYKTHLIPMEALCNPTWRTTLGRRPPPSTWCGPWVFLATSLAAPSPPTSSPSTSRKVLFRDLDPFLTHRP